MRIGLMIAGDMDAISGGYLYNRKLVAYLQSKDDEVVIISLPVRSFWGQLSDNFSHVLFKQIVDANLDVLIQDAMVHPSVFLLNRRMKIPVIALVHLLRTFDHQPMVGAWFYRTIERRYLQTVTGIIANSQTTLLQLQSLLNTPLPPHCVAVPAGNHFPEFNIDITALQQDMLSSNTLKILVVGNVIRRKGLHVLINAIKQLADDSFKVTVVGRLDMEPDYVSYVLKLVKKAGLHDQFIFTGPLQGLPLTHVYQQHHLMVLPSAYESYGIVYVEAQQFGLPVIGTTAGAAREIITHGDNGYLIPSGDHAALAGLLQQLHLNRQHLLTLSHNALVAYARHPSWDQSCEIIRQYLYDLISQSAK